MNDGRGTTERPAQSLWQKLKLALENMDESYVTDLESRIHLLELEVARLSELEKKRHGVSEPGVA